MLLLADNVNFNLNPAEGGLIAIFVAIYIAIIVVMIVALVKIVSKAGYSGWWVLSAFVPVFGTVMVLIFAFSDWPVLQELRSLRSVGAGSYGGMAMSGGWGGAASSPPPIQSEGPPPPPPPPS